MARVAHAVDAVAVTLGQLCRAKTNVVTARAAVIHVAHDVVALPGGVPWRGDEIAAAHRRAGRTRALHAVACCAVRTLCQPSVGRHLPCIRSHHNWRRRCACRCTSTQGRMGPRRHMQCGGRGSRYKRRRRKSGWRGTGSAPPRARLTETSQAPQLKRSIWKNGHGGHFQHMSSPVQQRHSPAMHCDVHVAHARLQSPQLPTSLSTSMHLNPSFCSHHAWPAGQVPFCRGMRPADAFAAVSTRRAAAH